MPITDSLASQYTSLHSAPLPPSKGYRIILPVPTAGEAGEQGHDGGHPRDHAQVDDQVPHRARIQGEEILSDAIRSCTSGNAGEGAGKLKREDEGVVLSSWVGDGKGSKRRRLMSINGEEVSKLHHNRALTRIGQVDGQQQLQQQHRQRQRRGEVEVDRFSGAEMPLWYTVPLRYPCLCQLEKFAYSLSPRLRPPQARHLYDLSPLDQTTKVASPVSKDDIPEWDSSSAAPEVRAHPAIVEEELDDFEYAWKLADGTWGTRWDGGCDDIASVTSVDDVRIRVVSRANDPPDAEALAMEVEGEEGQDLVRKDDAVNAATVAAIRSLDLSKAAGHKAKHDDWSEESKRRKEQWRRMIENDSGFGRMWTCVPPPYSLLAQYRATDQFTQDEDLHQHELHPAKPPLLRHFTPLPDFILPRALSLDTKHPFHPDLQHYIAKRPSARVYWIIPINGPLVIRAMNTFTSSSQQSRPPASAPASMLLPASSGISQSLAPSTASFGDTIPHTDPSTRPFPLRWTPLLLEQLWSRLGSLTRPVATEPKPHSISGSGPVSRRDEQFGNVSVMMSGPKPDPYLDVPSPNTTRTSDRHRCTIKGHRGNAPIEPEVGDHIRIYVDARYALRLRSWLYNLRLGDSSALGSSGLLGGGGGGGGAGSTVSLNFTALGQGAGGVAREGSVGAGLARQGDGVRWFNKVRLALIGDRGEVLVVA